MQKRIWILIAIGLSILAAYQAWLRGGEVVASTMGAILLQAPVSALGASTYLAATIALITAAGTGFVLVFLLVALVDSARVRRLNAGLTTLAETPWEYDEHERVDCMRFLEVFGFDQGLFQHATDFSVCLQEVGPHRKSNIYPTRLYATAPAATFFSRGKMVDTPLAAWFFRHLPRAMVGVGLVGLALGLLDGLSRFWSWRSFVESGAESPLDGLFVGLEIGLTSFAVAVGVAVAIGFLLQLVLSARYSQIEYLCRNIDALFNDGTQPEYRRKLSLAEADETRRMFSRAVGEVKRSGDRVVESVDSKSDTTGTALAESIGDILAKPLGDVARAAQRTAEDQGRQVEKLLRATLAAFIDALQKRFGNALGDVNKILKASDTMANDIQKSLATMTETLATQSLEQQEKYRQDVNQVIASESDRQARQADLFAEQIQEIAAELSQHVTGHASQFEAAIESLVERIEALASAAVATGTADLAKTAAEFSGLQTAVDSLVLSVTPSLNQVVDTQENLRAMLAEEDGAGKMIAAAAADLAQTAKVSRETMEKFIILARHLSDTSRALIGASAGDGALAATKSTPGAKSAATEDLSRALSDLREKTEGEDLPDL